MPCLSQCTSRLLRKDVDSAINIYNSIKRKDEEINTLHRHIRKLEKKIVIQNESNHNFKITLDENDSNITIRILDNNAVNIEKVKKDLKKVEKSLIITLQNITCSDNQNIDVTVQKISIIRNQIAKQQSDICAQRINPSELKDHLVSLKNHYHRGLKVKKLYNGFEVECKPIENYKNQEINVRVQNPSGLAIDFIRWMAPEQLERYEKYRCDENTYTFRNTNLGDPLAKYWLGYYLTYGYKVIEIDNERAKTLFKEAVDHDHSDAQCQYAVALLSDLKKEDPEDKKQKN
ncbi:34605_t:CDS:2 [Gigaspora margarita]|uniref:34605_t:CDS:1 n=1 Tax=Gigaspora margarita TaxID=4874 RepID=A0ABM8W2X4_GIGMA|nr:34605_t:CDS:2 [Gigaspora margarita]